MSEKASRREFLRKASAAAAAAAALSADNTVFGEELDAEPIPQAKPRAPVGADGIVNENRAAINSFANDGLAQVGPTLSELRVLIRDLRRLTDRLEGSPARYILGRDAAKEFEPK